MRMSLPILTTAAALVVAPALGAQMAEAPKPGPEHEELAYYVGNWTSAGKINDSPMGPGGPITATTSCERFTGNFYVVCRSDGTSPSGPTHGMWFLGYSAERQRYTYYGIDNTGMGAEPAYGQVSGDTWTWEWESTMQGQAVKGRYVTKHKSPDAYDWYWEISVAGGPFARMGEGTDTRAK